MIPFQCFLLMHCFGQRFMDSLNPFDSFAWKFSSWEGKNKKKPLLAVTSNQNVVASFSMSSVLLMAVWWYRLEFFLSWCWKRKIKIEQNNDKEIKNKTNQPFFSLCSRESAMSSLNLKGVQLWRKKVKEIKFKKVSMSVFKIKKKMCQLSSQDGFVFMCGCVCEVKKTLNLNKILRYITFPCYSKRDIFSTFIFHLFAIY